jgi:hypothetical protein
MFIFVKQEFALDCLIKIFVWREEPISGRGSGARFEILSPG